LDKHVLTIDGDAAYLSRMNTHVSIDHKDVLDIVAMQEEAKRNGTVICADFAERLNELASRAAAVSAMGDAAPVGVREIARQLADTLSARALNVKSILSKA
jgi:hypothetical protein